MTEPTSPEPRSLIDTAFEPYAIEIGFLLREWNDLQEKLGDLFTTILGIQDGGVARAIWNAVKHDRTQREMLKNVASHLFVPTEGPSDLDAKQRSERRLNAALWDEIKWIVESADYVGQRRDAVAHSPVALLLAEPLEFISHHLHGNPSAKSLKGKKLLKEFVLCRERATALRRHAEAIEQFIRYGQKWVFPKRPSWPDHRQTKKGTERRPAE